MTLPYPPNEPDNARRTLAIALSFLAIIFIAIALGGA